jgi:hypothetical protein
MSVPVLPSPDNAKINQYIGRLVYFLEYRVLARNDAVRQTSKAAAVVGQDTIHWLLGSEGMQGGHGVMDNCQRQGMPAPAWLRRR